MIFTSLVDKWRPRKLAEIAGQSLAVAAVKTKLRTGASFAVIAHGKPGLGKTSLAYAIAGELGSAEWHKGGGFRIVASNRQGVECLAEVFSTLAFRPMIGGQWRVVCFEECELKSKAAVNYLKTAIEQLPAHVVVIFTSNAELDDFADDAIAERCLCLRFEHRAEKLAADAQALVSRVWEQTLGYNHAPTLADLGIADNGRLSFRAVLAALEPVLLAELPEQPEPTIEQLAALPLRDEGETVAEFEARTAEPVLVAPIPAPVVIAEPEPIPEPVKVWQPAIGEPVKAKKLQYHGKLVAGIVKELNNGMVKVAGFWFKMNEVQPMEGLTA